MFIGDFVVGNRGAIRMEESICIQMVKLNHLGEILLKGSVIGGMYFEYIQMSCLFFFYLSISVSVLSGNKKNQKPVKCLKNNLFISTLL